MSATMTDAAATVTSAAAVKRVLLVDDHPIVRQGLAQMIDHQPDLRVVAEANGATDGVRMAEEQRPDVAVVDLSLADGTGLELVRELKARLPQMPVLVLSMHDETLHAERALRAGAMGYIMKQEATEAVLGAIRKVLAGERYLSERCATRMVNRALGTPAAAQGSPLAALSEREMQVFEMIGSGEPPRRIAEKLGLSVKTVEAHRERIKEKLKLPSAAELLRFAMTYLMDGQRRSDPNPPAK